MEDWYKSAVNDFENYVNSFSGLTPEQQRNFDIKRDHTLRVAGNVRQLAVSLSLNEEDEKIAVLAAVFHDIGRFSQIAEHNTLNDSVSADHAEIGSGMLRTGKYLSSLTEESRELVITTILHHNKLEIPKNIGPREMLHARLLRDADKLDILRVLTDYYAGKNKSPNHMLTWELPKSAQISAGVVKEILSGKLVSKKEVKNEADVKVMQLSWIYDINFKTTVGMILRNRYLERIYESLPKNDQIFEIYRKIKVFAENKMME